jgi:uncharacterized protein YdeI (YjbR/CyaY-like superfamily)
MTTMPSRDPRFDDYIRAAPAFAQPILTRLRALVHEACPAVEEAIKWRNPSFMHNKALLCGMAAFKAHCMLGFWKDSLLQPRLSKSDAAALQRLGRMTSAADLPADRTVIRIVRIAAAMHDEGVKAPSRPRPTTPQTIETPAILADALRRNRKAQAAFDAFSYSKKKDYVEWLTDAKSDETRARRLATAIEWIAEGKGRNWKYEKQSH